MASSLAPPFRAALPLAMAALAAAVALAGLLQSEPAGDAPPAADLAACRPIVPAGARVLAVTDRVPAPDFDFWLGIPRPVRLLVRLRAGSIRAGGPETPRMREAVERELRARSVLYSEGAMGTALDESDFVVVEESALDDPLRALLAPHPIAFASPRLALRRVVRR